MIGFEYRRRGDILLQKSSSRERDVRVIEKHMPFICCPLYGSYVIHAYTIPLHRIPLSFSLFLFTRHNLQSSSIGLNHI